MDDTNTIIIGAGLAGLTLARHLADQGISVIVLEKSRSPGGRLATRRSDHGNFDHGGQYLTSRTPEFTSLVNHLAQAGELAVWRPRGKDSARPWWVGLPGMSAVGKALTEGLQVHLGTTVTRIGKQQNKYLVEVETAGGVAESFRAARVVTAIPAPQALKLLHPLDSAFAPLAAVKMAPCWSAMLAFETRLDDVPDLIRGQPGDCLSLIVRNSSKPQRRGETFVLHAGPEWSDARLDEDHQTVAAELLVAMRAATGLGADLPKPVHFDLHRWLHALAQTQLGAPFIGNADGTLFACGDWCIAARAEAAHQSGLALGQHILAL
ncbi:FAD-dependent oxidoreductase [Hoeflea sp. G2-23]|uniref:FAD-dependent oxidoreductase n=1 Tax=Hoeflea algicola TaxID=2983763 RepID=A0ABT3Z9C9_9HYPH|nr:FAD-dependent oxidoreductase [Hoeflea algicola]MCY0148395.1 FAD-dependent oxidoreductase [Hoeflea algicola]